MKAGTEHGEEGLRGRQWQRVRGLGLSPPSGGAGKGGTGPEIGALIAKRGLTQAAAAEVLQIDQPKVSALVRGRLWVSP